MRADHPIALGAKWLQIAVDEAKACAREAHGCAALLYMDELKLSTHFSGKGGAEMVACLVTALFFCTR